MANVATRPAVGGKRWRVLADDLSYPTDPAVIRRLARGESLTEAERGAKVVVKGAIVDDIPEQSIAACLAQGWIEDVDKPAPKAVPVPVTVAEVAAPVAMAFTEAEDDDDEGAG